MARKTKLGRRPIDPAEKKVLLGFYTTQKYIDKLGGLDRARSLAKLEFERNVIDYYYNPQKV